VHLDDQDLNGRSPLKSTNKTYSKWDNPTKKLLNRVISVKELEVAIRIGIHTKALLKLGKIS
jgi:hypothetical protein